MEPKMLYAVRKLAALPRSDQWMRQRSMCGYWKWDVNMVGWSTFGSGY